MLKTCLGSVGRAPWECSRGGTFSTPRGTQTPNLPIRESPRRVQGCPRRSIAPGESSPWFRWRPWLFLRDPQRMAPNVAPAGLVRKRESFPRPNRFAAFFDREPACNHTSRGTQLGHHNTRRRGRMVRQIDTRRDRSLREQPQLPTEHHREDQEPSVGQSLPRCSRAPRPSRTFCVARRSAAASFSSMYCPKCFLMLASWSGQTSLILATPASVIAR
jgi:hypothetical protein